MTERRGKMTSGGWMLLALLGAGSAAASDPPPPMNLSDAFNTPLPTPFIQNIRSGETQLGDVMIQGAAKTLGLYLHGITLKELAIHKMEQVLDDSTFSDKSSDDSETAKHIAASISNKLEKYKSLLAKSRSAIEGIYNASSRPTLALPSHGQCCDFSPMQLKYNPNFGVSINRDLFCDTLVVKEPDNANLPQSSNLSSVFSTNLAAAPGLRWQYLLHVHGQELIYPGWGNPGRPCQPTSVNHNKVLIDTMYRHSKQLVIIIDLGLGMTATALELAKETAKFVINLLTDSDSIAVIALDGSPNVLTPYPSESGLMGKLVKMCQQTRFKLQQMIDRLQVKDGAGDLKAGMNAAQKTLENSGAGDTAQILFITHGNRENQQKIESTVVAASSAKIETKLTVATVFDPTHEKLRPNWLPETVRNILVYSKESLALNKLEFFSGTRKVDSNAMLHTPRLDTVGGGMVVSMSQVVTDEIGVVGLDIQLEELLEDIVHAPFKEHTRLFLIDENGLTLSHPSLESPPGQWSSASLPHISTLETSEGFKDALNRIKSFPSGTFKTDSDVYYTWEQVKGSNYIAVVASDGGSSRPEKILASVPILGDFSDIQHHDLIAEGKSKLCKHMREIASMQAAALYLSPAAYAAPFEHMAALDSSQRTTSFMAYLTDPTRLIANPGLKAGVRNDVNLISHVVEPWKQLAFSSPLNNYIVRRRIFTPRGVQLSYPGASIEEGSDPSKEFWFQKAVKFPNRLVVSPPRLDPGGAGFIITVSKALRASNSSDENFLAGVVSADYTLGYFYKILNDTVPRDFCSEAGNRCFLIDDQGNMVAHPDLVKDVMKYVSFPSETQHFTHMEFFIATDLLLNLDYITKKVCRSLLNGKLQRYFQLNTSSLGVIGNSGSLDHCTQYKLTAVPGTNLFLGLVNQSCESHAFCWCSTLDRTCLDCQSWEQGQCECPCECDSKAEYCGVGEETEQPVPVCAVAPTQYQPQRYSTARHDLYPPCIHTDCSARWTEQDCYGVLGCSWCNRDGDTPLASPVCLEQAECFGGVLHSASPYSRAYDQSLVLMDSEDDRSLSRAGPIGPVAGGIMAFFLLLALTVWGYKHWSSGDRGLLSGLHGSSQRINQLEEEPDEGAPGGGQLNYGLHQGDPGHGITVVSPYRMNPSYRRPRPAGTDSDHGYSTMTPGGDQDSEIMSCLGDNQRRLRSKNPLSLQSVTSGTSSRTSSPLQGPLEMAMLSSSSDEKQVGSNHTTERDNLMVDGQLEPLDKAPEKGPGRNQVPGPTATTVLNKNQFIVSATVHMVDT